MGVAVSASRKDFGTVAVCAPRLPASLALLMQSRGRTKQNMLLRQRTQSSRVRCLGVTRGAANTGSCCCTSNRASLPVRMHERRRPSPARWLIALAPKHQDFAAAGSPQPRGTLSMPRFGRSRSRENRPSEAIVEAGAPRSWTPTQKQRQPAHTAQGVEVPTPHAQSPVLPF
jgi:hypothetical protein